MSRKNHTKVLKNIDTSINKYNIIINPEIQSVPIPSAELVPHSKETNEELDQKIETNKPARALGIVSEKEIGTGDSNTRGDDL